MACTTLSIELPAAFRIASTFRRHWRVCSWIVSPTTSPSPDRKARPETKTRPLAFTAWLYPARLSGVVGANDLLRHGTSHYRAPIPARSLDFDLRNEHPGAPKSSSSMNTPRARAASRRSVRVRARADRALLGAR